MNHTAFQNWRKNIVATISAENENKGENNNSSKPKKPISPAQQEILNRKKKKGSNLHVLKAFILTIKKYKIYYYRMKKIMLIIFWPLSGSFYHLNRLDLTLGPI